MVSEFELAANMGDFFPITRRHRISARIEFSFYITCVSPLFPVIDRCVIKLSLLISPKN